MTTYLASYAHQDSTPAAWTDERAAEPEADCAAAAPDPVAALQVQLQQRDVLLATVAHELRNCLEPLCSATELLARAAEESTRAVAASMARRQIKIMSSLVTDLLDYGRLAAPRASDRGRLVLQHVVEDAVDACRPALEQQQHRVSLELAAQSLCIDADANQLSQVFANLLNNAIKFTPCGGEIAVSVARSGDMAEVRLTDNGVGIAAGDLERIFELFHQDRRQHLLARRGLGIGLAVVRRLVERHGGSAQATSPGPGRGSTFIVRLPLAGA